MCMTHSPDDWRGEGKIRNIVVSKADRLSEDSRTIRNVEIAQKRREGLEVTPAAARREHSVFVRSLRRKAGEVF